MLEQYYFDKEAGLFSVGNKKLVHFVRNNHLENLKGIGNK